MLGFWRHRVLALALAAGTIGVGGLPASADGASVGFTDYPLVSVTGRSVSHDFEPAIRIGPDSTVYTAANYHNTATGARGVELWTAAPGAPFASVGLIPPGLGGLDVDLAVGSTGTLYDATLYSQTPNAPTGSYGIGTGACPAGSLPDPTACYGVQKVDISHTDRPWIAADGPSTVYLSYHDGSQSEQIDVTKSTDAGRTWGKPAEAIVPALRHQANFYNFAGNLVVDPRDHTIYQIFVAGPTPGKGQNQDYNTVYMAVSRDGGQTFADYLVYQAPAGARLDNLWPAATVDASGGVYAGWSDGHDVWIAASTDHGATWAAPFRVSQDGPALQSSVEPWLAAGGTGDVGVAWYGSPAADNMSATATWQVYFAQVRGATSAAPTISQTVVSDHTISTGPLCTEGDACPAGTRTLYDDLGVALDPATGLAAVAYDDASDPTNPYQVVVARQRSGPGL
jgi:hypothetical protein